MFDTYLVFLFVKCKRVHMVSVLDRIYRQKHTHNRIQRTKNKYITFGYSFVVNRQKNLIGPLLRNVNTKRDVRYLRYHVLESRPVLVDFWIRIVDFRFEKFYKTIGSSWWLVVKWTILEEWRGKKKRNKMKQTKAAIKYTCLVNLHFCLGISIAYLKCCGIRWINFECSNISTIKGVFVSCKH